MLWRGDSDRGRLHHRVTEVANRERRLFLFLSPALRGTRRANLSVGPLRHASCIRCAREPFSDKVTASKRRAVIFFFENGGTEIHKGRNLSPPVPKKAILGGEVNEMNR